MSALELYLDADKFGEISDSSWEVSDSSCQVSDTLWQMSDTSRDLSDMPQPSPLACLILRASKLPRPL